MGRETQKGKNEMKHWIEQTSEGWAVKNDKETVGTLTSEMAARTAAEALNYQVGDNQFNRFSMGRWAKEQAA